MKGFLDSQAGGQAMKWGVIVVGALAAGYFVLYKIEGAIGKVGDAAGNAARAAADAATYTATVGVNPLERQNWFYRGVNGVVDVLDDGTRNDSNTLGTWTAEKVGK